LQSFTKRSGDLLSRYGGEEFLAILPETTHKNALILAEKMCKEVEAARIPHSQSKVSSYITVSLGVATTVPAADMSQDALISAADKALYAAKEEGRNRVKAVSVGTR